MKARCGDCPRSCGVDRAAGGIGYCGGGKYARVAKTVYGFGYEEPCLGEVTAVFFGGCSLKCSYCQNHIISRGAAGEEYDDDRLAALFDGSTAPIDLVTPTHFGSAIARAADKCKKEHLFIYNTSGYESGEGVRRAATYAHVFLSDFKYGDDRIARKYSGVDDYTEKARAALSYMRKSVDVFDGRGIMTSGLIVRHLVLPGEVKNSLLALDMIADAAGADTMLSLMSQFTPNGVGKPDERLKKIEYKLVLEHALKLGFKNGYMQGFDSAASSFTPEFKD